MRNIFIISWFTLREAMARKVFMFFAGISLLVLIISVLVFSLVDTQTFISAANQGAVRFNSKGNCSRIRITYYKPAGRTLPFACYLF